MLSFLFTIDKNPWASHLNDLTTAWYGGLPLKSVAFIRISCHHIPPSQYPQPSSRDRQRWFQSSQNCLSSSCGGLKKYFSKYFSEVFLMWNMLNLLSPLSTSWPCPLKPGRARPLYSHQSIIWHQPQVVTQFQDGHIFQTVRSQVMSHTDVTCGGGLLPLVWAQAGLLVSWLPQLTRHTGAGRGQRSS